MGSPGARVTGATRRAPMPQPAHLGTRQLLRVDRARRRPTPRFGAFGSKRKGSGLAAARFGAFGSKRKGSGLAAARFGAVGSKRKGSGMATAPVRASTAEI